MLYEILGETVGLVQAEARHPEIPLPVSDKGSELIRLPAYRPHALRHSNDLEELRSNSSRRRGAGADRGVCRTREAQGGPRTTQGDRPRLGRSLLRHEQASRRQLRPLAICVGPERDDPSVESLRFRELGRPASAVKAVEPVRLAPE